MIRTKFKCMFKHIWIGGNLVKTITIRDEVYGKLSMTKREGESFSELLERLVEEADPSKTLMKLRGRVEFKNKKKILAEIRSRRAERRL